MSELEAFVLGYLKQVEGLVEPAGYGIHEVLLPERVAQRWDTAVYQQITFADTVEAEATHLGYNHPLVEQMVEEARTQSASTKLYINELQLNKTDLDKLAAKEWVILNGRVMPQKRATIARVRSTYVRFNFKAAIVSDEKQERLASVLMDAHAGHRIAQTDLIEAKATAGEPDMILDSLSDAPMRWQSGAGRSFNSPLNQQALTVLLDRAKTAVLHEMSDYLKSLQTRVNRFRELDEARLTAYYDELERDLQVRLTSASHERRSSLQDKLVAVQTERAHKLIDVAERYRVKVDLTLLNLMIIQQPKLVMPVLIENRTTKASAYAVWDPLLHRLEMLACEVCGQPSGRTYLCHNGHLAHEGCLAPACIDCKRVFCRQCADQVGACDVCHEPLCHHSRILCPECGRGTCQAHQGLCHANAGQPVDLTVKAAPPPPKPEPKPPEPKPKSKTPKRPQPKQTQSARKLQKTAAPPPLLKGVPKPQRIEVVIYPDAVVAFLLASREREIAVRTWELNLGEGIIRTCECEKGTACTANRMVIRPSEWEPIEEQLLKEIAAFRTEYGLPPKKISFNRVSSLDGLPFPTQSFKLFGLWKEEGALAKARAGFERIYWKK